MSGSGSRSTYRSKAILRSTLPSGAFLIAAVICCRSSPCSAGGSTTRAAATNNTEPERLRQLSGVAHHIDKRGKPVTFCHHFVGISEMVCFREVTKTSVCVCSACHDILLTVCFPQHSLCPPHPAHRSTLAQGLPPLRCRPLSADRCPDGCTPCPASMPRHVLRRFPA